MSKRKYDLVQTLQQLSIHKKCKRIKQKKKRPRDVTITLQAPKRRKFRNWKITFNQVLRSMKPVLRERRKTITLQNTIHALTVVLKDQFQKNECLTRYIENCKTLWLTSSCRSSSVQRPLYVL